MTPVQVKITGQMLLDLVHVVEALNLEIVRIMGSILLSFSMISSHLVD